MMVWGYRGFRDSKGFSVVVWGFWGQLVYDGFRGAPKSSK